MEINTSNEPVTISSDPPKYAASDFRFLRSEGIKWIQKLAAISWTDHNSHDPGITILDLLCYAITDLSYRLDYDIKDLLAVESGDAYESLYSPAQVLTVNPVTLSDFRKIMLDIDGVKNAWIENQTEADTGLYYLPDENELRLTDNGNKSQLLAIKGIYNISLDLESGSINKEVADRLHSCRNLCEDYNKITTLSYQYLAVSGIIEIGQTDDINKTAAGILFRIASFISPVINFYTLTEMLAKGKTVDEIFEGPALAHGFIDEDELSSADVKTELHTSDIIREMMDEPGVLRVSNIRIYINEGSSSATSVQNWFLKLDTTKIPVLDVEERNGTWLTDKLIFRKNGALLTTDADKIKSFFAEFKIAKTDPLLSIKDRDIAPEPGTYYRVSDYYSIQNHFPQVYGISETGLPESASLLRKAQAKQLKAYLLFFEQILSDHFAQAEHLKDLFSFSNTNPRTYFYQSLQNIVPGTEEIFVAESDKRIPGYIESPDNALQRKNRFLDHLIARFGENLSEYSLLAQSYPTNSSFADDLTLTNTLEKLVSDKLRFLASYPRISNDRGKAFNYEEESWETNNISGLEKRIAAKLGIENFGRQSLADGKEGFHVLEHILLRPTEEDGNAIAPYSIAKMIDSFEDAGNGHTICNSKEHGLINGEQILISESKVYDNSTYRIIWITRDRFQIDSSYKGAEENTALWIRYTDAPNTRLLVFGKVISGFTENGNGPTTTICISQQHGLVDGRNIRITETNHYNGLYNNIKVIDENLFEIQQPFTEAETTGWWADTDQQPDFYSLQLTCIFPAGTGRFTNPGFRTFVENTVREETPVHLTVYIRWLDSTQVIQQFERFFKRYLEEKKKSADTGTLQATTSFDIALSRLETNKIALRANRNSLIDMLPPGISAYPLADIPVIIPDKAAELIIPYNEPATIQLLYSQPDVIYKVWDETNALMNRNQDGDQSKENDDKLFITTIPLTRDNYTFSIEAINSTTNLRVQLFQTISVRIGINTNLDVSADESYIDYGTNVTITVKNAQSSTLYQLFDADGKITLSDMIDSVNGGDLKISTKEPLYEDTIITINATNSHTNESAFLIAKSEIKVYPNTALEIAEPEVADYNGESAVIIKHTQQSASYYLRFEDIDDDTVNKEALKGTIIGDIVPGNNETIRLPIKNLKEDIIVSVTAQKNVSKIEKTFPELIFIPVKPDTNKALSIVEENIKAGDTATIKVNNTQRGILYQLRQVNSDNTYTNIGNPVYHHKNYGIGKARVEIEFVIDTFIGDSVFLPAGVIRQTTTFNVLAIKATTKQQAEIGNITIEIKQ